MTAEPALPAPPPAPHQRPEDRPPRAAKRRRGWVIGVRVSALERAQLQAKAEALRLSCAAYLRQAALARQLKAPPVAAVNREQYVELSRLAENLDDLTRLAHAGQVVTPADALLQRLHHEVGRLRLELIGAVPLRQGAAGSDRTDAHRADTPSRVP